ncbi:hypothetical protein [Niveispirillum fermenti]|uniref:hypothetical protein n=1 Tax=Niveispirillum fermenti TaxID=1233113 RepID=UPI003A87370B
MLRIDHDQVKVLEAAAWPVWVDRHAEQLAVLLPEVAALYPGQAFRDMVDGLLRRADLHGMVTMGEAVAYLYAALTLGIGFETRSQLAWVPAALAATGESRAALLWKGVEQEAGRAEART